MASDCTINPERGIITLQGEANRVTIAREAEGKQYGNYGQYTSDNGKAWWAVLESSQFTYIATVEISQYGRTYSKTEKFNVRKENQRNGQFWYIYKKHNGKLQKRYVGIPPTNTEEAYKQINEAIKRIDLVGQFHTDQ